MNRAFTWSFGLYDDEPITIRPTLIARNRRPTIMPQDNLPSILINTLPGYETVTWDGVYRPDLPSIRDRQQLAQVQPFRLRESLSQFYNEHGYFPRISIPEAARVQHPPEGRPVYAMPIGNNVRPDTITQANYYHPIDGKRTTWNKLRDFLPKRTKKAAPVHPSSRNGGKRKRRKNTRKKRI